ncbi:MAG: cytochrome c biogenesis protein CcsA [Paludibacteraceae bacterium]|nr:cytochrome c biogenesis protein CcsA [Paludibacteraceae bacterium]
MNKLCKIFNFKRLAFLFSGILLVLLILATIIEPVIGTKATVEKIYTSPLTIVLWIATVCFSLVYLFQRKVYKNVITFLIHFSFVIILLGAFVTHVFGEQGKIHLRLNEPENMYIDSEGLVQTFPFVIELIDFDVEYYRGTRSPMDFVSEIQVKEGQIVTSGVVSMNNIFVYRNYRFYQSGYDADNQGVLFAISRDPYGIAVTYFGYAFLLFSLGAFFFQKNTLLRQILKKRSLLAIFALIITIGVEATPRTLQPELAERFSQLYVYYNGRVCPLQTLANDFCQKIYGKTSYKEFSAEQVLVGWLFYCEDWKNEPMIKIRGESVRLQLGIEGKYACLNDFFNAGEYKLERLVRERIDKNVQSADEKINLIEMVSSGSLLRIFPSKDANGELCWYSWAEQLPTDIPFEQMQMMKKMMLFVTQEIEMGRSFSLLDSLEQISIFQKTEAGENNLPHRVRFLSEQVYNKMHITKPLAIFSLMFGLLLFVLYVYYFGKERKPNRILSNLSIGVLSLLLVLVSVMIVLRGVVSGHLPFSNGFETMQFLAWITLIFSLLLNKKINLFLPFGFLLCGLSLLVAMMSAANPQITQLIPILSSPLLSIHVVIIIFAYSMLSFLMLNGLVAVVFYLFCKNRQQQIERLYVIGKIMLYPALFCLVVGIFVGAVWANVSWGRYWGWDPKEVWALITMILYAFPIHSKSISLFRKPMFFHFYVVFAFFAVLFTYFGVNYLLGGLHSYV